ncbi:MAG: diaminopimelate epimerase [Fimbriimonas ginsengisoli]|uniref:Diaminopimelate epimerase n=1 Tax=Fimbriimonas ginsengisoli TaxID=1005039 RepID=A0A931PTJ3_FIMGI|nr:diaminopimelate epimerase [Fimbriimonas ginsengisoli]
MTAFAKMHGIGNDFVILDTIRDATPERDWTEFSSRVCDRRFGIGADGLILVELGKAAPYRMRMFNPDGSESEMCGNGVRCVARLLHEHGHTRAPKLDVETGAGVLGLEPLLDGRVRVDMGVARLTRGEIGMTGPAGERFVDQPVAGEIKGTAVSMGNPHLVIFVDDVQAVDLKHLGPKLEHSPLYPHRTNVHFVQVVSPGRLVQRTWERGAGATLACGTGACASAVASRLARGGASRTIVRLPGGDLEIEVGDDFHVHMTGAASLAFEGVWPD